MFFAQTTYHYTISFEDLPMEISKKFVIDQFSQHQHHLGGWPVTFPINNLSQYDHLPIVDTTSHVVRTVGFNNEGGLDISFEFITTPRGNALMKQYDTSKFKMVPVTDEKGINIYRFDFIYKED